MNRAALNWIQLLVVLNGMLIPCVQCQTQITLTGSGYTINTSTGQPRKVIAANNYFIGISSCQVVLASVGSPGTKTLTTLSGTYDASCDTYYISEYVDTSNALMAIDARGVLSIFQFSSNMQSYVRTTYLKLPYTAYYYPRVYKADRVPNTDYYFVASLQTNILFKVLVQNGGTAVTTRYLTNAKSQSYETLTTTSNNRLVIMSASGQFMEVWDTTTMTFLATMDLSPFVFGNIYRSVAYYPIVTQQDFIMAPKTGMVAHFIDLTNKLIIYEYPIRQDNPEFCYHVPLTNYFAAEQ